MALAGYTLSEDLLYTSIEITASTLALHLACQYELRCWIAVSSLKRALGQPLRSERITRKPFHVILWWFSGFMSTWNHIGYSNDPKTGSVLRAFDFGYFMMISCVAVYMGLVAVLPLPRAASTSRINSSLSARLRQCVYPPNHVRFMMGLVIPPLVVYSTYIGLRALHSVMIAGWLCGLFAFFSPKQVIMKRRILWLNGLMIIVLFLSGFESDISWYLSFIFRGREPEQQAQWLLRLWLSLCPVVPSIMAGLLIGPALRFDISRAEGSIPYLQYYADVGVPIPRTVQSFPKHLYRVAMIGFIFARFLRQLRHTHGDSRQITDLRFAFECAAGVSLSTAILAWSSGCLREWWDYREDWTMASPASLAEEGEKDEVKHDAALESGRLHPSSDPVSV